MSALPAIEVQGVRKRYVIGGRSDDYTTLRDAVAGILLSPFRRLAGRGAPEEHHWALDGVSFSVAPGEVVGVVGRNGAGKSTLLKVLSRITEPTEGRVVVRGRVGSLLEVGTGFHPELSGRENIFLNGAILGMRRAEIARKFDEIVAFSEVAKFVDTPVKHYSSGMYLRLAFAVAAHLEPEVLLIDEVLAVGDVAFQKKCIGKMDDVAKQGRTVLFVSHNMAAIRALCSRTVVIEGGRVAFDGPSVDGIRRYQELLAAAPTDQAGDRSVFGAFTIDGSTDLAVDPDRPFTLKFRMRVPADVARPQLFCLIDDAAGNLLVHERLDLEETLEAGLRDVELAFPALWLRTGPYGVTLRLHGMAGLTNGRWAAEKRMLDVRSKPELGGGKLDGFLAAATTWRIERTEGP